MPVPELDKLTALSFSKQIGFAYLACERIFPNYECYSRTYKFGDATALRQAIDFVYDSIFSSNISIAKASQLLPIIDRETPETDGTLHTTIAMYAGGVIYESVNLL